MERKTSKATGEKRLCRTAANVLTLCGAVNRHSTSQRDLRIVLCPAGFQPGFAESVARV
ncbi:hypothetical protein M2451_003677 [Dysgonomonas sp. PFB1-18]|uniref:hypothetical protein n=1 Tax=unclassified Dysgonomonas TaxID=2630389 RepID=UPI0024746ECC|nr:MULTISPECIES: hypothetical protein [unclassified Dysgonomonas]MDH6310866.1 hypothetical protein [Dysgonomonas sp. PF1-14]MDH6340696.1 hypothetical protein [Dysgonomonas sp. PF1-16]MDH6382336.1 hypothetical protein [Dysgonomonas sp. PFB1-18]MDH6399686.1 hypothetical protein [Dysgonomonas sp. PF1-23]